MILDVVIALVISVTSGIWCDPYKQIYWQIFWRWCMVFRVPEKDRKTFRKGFKRTAWAYHTARRKTETIKQTSKQKELIQ